MPSKVYICISCGKNIGTQEECLCGSRAYGKAFCVWQYNGAARKTMFEYKYQRHKEAMVNLLAYMRPSQLAMIIKIVAETKNPIIIPVPLHKKKVSTRGFDQNEIIAKMLSQITNTKVIRGKAVERAVNTETQTSMRTKEERIANVFGAFAVTKPDELFGKTAIVVDDILTTGATVRSLADSIYPYTRTKTSVIAVAHEGVRM